MKNVADFYPLSPMQQGMLFHSLYEPASGVYVEQLSCVLKGDLNQSAMDRAWKKVIDRHPALKTSFMWEGLDEPIQLVHRNVELDITKQDWRGLSAEKQSAKKEAFLLEERKKGFELSKPPLIRLALMRLADNSFLLILTWYHAIIDGWSLPNVLKEVFIIYEAFSQDRDLQLEPVRPYRDYIVWINKQDLSKAEAYWKKTLKGFTASTPLRFDYLGGTVPTKDAELPDYTNIGYGLEGFVLSPDTLSKLQVLARQHRLTLNTLIQGAWALLLSRYSGDDEVVFGSTVSGRPAELAGSEYMVGLFINTLPVKVKITPHLPLLDWLKEVQSQAVEMRQYEHSPLVKIQGWSDVPRNVPLFDSILVFENYPLDTSSIKGSLEIVDFQAIEQTNLPITLAAIPEKERWWLKILYERQRFKPHAIKRILEHLNIIVDTIANNPELPLSGVSILTKKERQEILTNWNATKFEYPQDLCIHQVFENQVVKSPDAISVIFENESLSYYELNRRANQLAHFLKKLGVGPEVIVGISVERSFDMVTGLLGILKSGAAYLPLDPNYPKERLTFMLDDARVPLILTQKHLAKNLPEKGAQIISLDEKWDEITREVDENLTREITPDNLAYVIYTSGSTGRPKGTLLHHRGLRNLVSSQTQSFGVKVEDRVLQFASFGFDASVSETFMALATGAKLCLAEQETLSSGPDLLNLLREKAITNMTMPPSLQSNLTSDDLPALNTIVSAGEKCQWDHVSKWANGRKYFNAYGPTEATIGPTLGLVDGEMKSVPSVPIGKPIFNTQVYLIDSNMQPVPVGVPGEIHIGGVSLARGYINRPDLTAEKFVPNPFDRNEGSRLYKTGDLARFLLDGKIEFLGRIDYQIKMRGFRIELGELEAVLKEHLSVKDAVAIVREDTPGNERLLAYVIPVSSDQLELWPSVAEFFVYDDLLYFAMTNDDRRNASYKVAINKLVKDKVVLDIGTGKDAILARLCVESGAKKVYAVDILKDSYEKAKACVKNLGLDDQIIVIHGDSTKVKLPEKVDVCISEIVGPIGGSEGAGVILNDARRFLKDDGVMIPERSVTKFAAVSLPDEFFEDPGFTEMTKHYAEQIFEQVGYRFDFRLSLKGLTYDNLISNTEIFEDLDFSNYSRAEFSHSVTFTFSKNGRMDGFLAWLNLHTTKGEIIDILEYEYSWLPVFFPVFYPGIPVSKGDRIEAVVTSTLCENNLNPDYTIKGKLIKKGEKVKEFEYTSFHFKNSYKATPFYELLFENDSILVRKDSGRISSKELKNHIRKYLPEHMIPSGYILMESFPFTPNGKVDRQALPAPDGTRPDIETTFVPPRTPVEKELAKMWAGVLGAERIGINDNFFDLGGHSLMATQLNSKIREIYQVDVSLRDFFEAPTIASLALEIAKTQADLQDTSKLETILSEIEDLSDEEVQKLMNDETRQEEDTRDE